MNAIKNWWNSFYVETELELFNGLEFGIRHIPGTSLDEMVDLEEGEEHHFGVLLSFACFNLVMVFIKNGDA